MKLTTIFTIIILWQSCAKTNETQDPHPNSPNLADSVFIPGVESSQFTTHQVPNNHVLFDIDQKEYLVVDMNDPLIPRLVGRSNYDYLGLNVKPFVTPDNKHILMFSSLKLGVVSLEESPEARKTFGFGPEGVIPVENIDHIYPTRIPVYQESNSIRQKDQYIFMVAINGNFETSLQVYDFSEPLTPKMVTSIANFEKINNLDIVGDELIVTVFNQPTIVFDISDPTQLTEKRKLEHELFPTGAIWIEEDRMVKTLNEHLSIMKIFPVGSGKNLIGQTHFQFRESDEALAGPKLSSYQSLVYLTDSKGIRVISTENNEIPILVGYTEKPSRTHSHLLHFNDYVVLTSTWGEFFVYHR